MKIYLYLTDGCKFLVAELDYLSFLQFDSVNEVSTMKPKRRGTHHFLTETQKISKRK